jgi:hypothetical protein
MYFHWSLTLGKKNRMRVFESRMIRKILGPNRNEVRWDWRRLYYEELHNLSCSPYIIRVMEARKIRWFEHVERKGEQRYIQDTGAET